MCEFRRRHLADFAHLFREVVQLARELGLVELGALAIDGTKLRANASKRKAMSYGRMLREEQRLRIEIDALLAQAEAVDAAEDNRFGPDQSGFERSGELQRRNDRLKSGPPRRGSRPNSARRMTTAAADRDRSAIRGAGSRTRCSYGAPDPKAQANFTDPESSIMKTSTDGNIQQCYNAQIAVDGTQQLIVAADLSAHPSDQGQLHAVLDQVEANVKQRPLTVLADAGYCNERDLALLETKGIEGYVAVGRDGRRAAGARPRPATARMAAKLVTGDGKARYAYPQMDGRGALRAGSKRVLGFRQFSLRGQWPAACEWESGVHGDQHPPAQCAPHRLNGVGAGVCSAGIGPWGRQVPKNTATTAPIRASSAGRRRKCVGLARRQVRRPSMPRPAAQTPRSILDALACRLGIWPPQH